MAASMDVDTGPVDLSATLRELPQVLEPPITHPGLPLPDSMRRLPIAACICGIRAARLTHLDAQASSTVNPPRRYPSRYTSGGQKETPGCTWGVLRSRWTQRDTPHKLVSQFRLRNCCANSGTDLLTPC